MISWKHMWLTKATAKHHIINYYSINKQLCMNKQLIQMKLMINNITSYNAVILL